jgi:hypothetical protein
MRANRARIDASAFCGVSASDPALSAHRSAAREFVASRATRDVRCEFMLLTALATLAVGTANPAPASTARSADAFRFAVVGHIRGGPGDGNVPRAKLEALAAELKRRELDFVVLTGDIVWGDFEAQGEPNVDAIRRDFEAIDEVLATVGAPLHRVPGNHDIWDARTRDLWLERYGPLFSGFDHKGSRFVLLCSPWLPARDGERCPGGFIRGAPLPSEQIAFVREQTQSASESQHVFVFLHHMLWWPANSSWWSDVHPLLAAAPTRAVFAGDMGPWKFSCETRDDVHYVQSAVDFTDLPPLEMLRNREESRALAAQLDNFVVVSVDGPRVDYEVATVGALSAPHRDAATWRAIHSHDAGTFRRKLFNRMNTPERAFDWLVRGLAAAGFAGALVGGLAVWLWARRRAR